MGTLLRQAHRRTREPQRGVFLVTALRKELLAMPLADGQRRALEVGP